ncbi:MAG: hypothetical protein PHU27_06220 [Salinivirgaceae bacterium]|nr:hypothetical protein [Salinivirgaceae bacterium]
MNAERFFLAVMITNGDAPSDIVGRITFGKGLKITKWSGRTSGVLFVATTPFYCTGFTFI